MEALPCSPSADPATPKRSNQFSDSDGGTSQPRDGRESDGCGALGGGGGRVGTAAVDMAGQRRMSRGPGHVRVSTRRGASRWRGSSDRSQRHR